MNMIAQVAIVLIVALMFSAMNTMLDLTTVLIVGRSYYGMMSNMKLFKKLHKHNFNKFAYTSNVVQFDNMGYPLRLCIMKCDCGMTNQEWIDVLENSVTNKDVILKWGRL